MAFMFFGIGGYCSINKIDVTMLTYKLRYYIYIVAAILWIVCTMFNGHNTKTGDLIYPFYVIVGCMALINIATHFVKNNISHLMMNYFELLYFDFVDFDFVDSNYFLVLYLF